MERPRRLAGGLFLTVMTVTTSSRRSDDACLWVREGNAKRACKCSVTDELRHDALKLLFDFAEDEGEVYVLLTRAS